MDLLIPRIRDGKTILSRQDFDGRAVFDYTVLRLGGCAPLLNYGRAGNCAGSACAARPALVLSVGFGGLILFILAAAIGTMVLLDRVRGDETRIRQAFLDRLRTLEQIRSEIYLSGTDMRDFLLSPGAGGVDAPRAGYPGHSERKRRPRWTTYARSLDPEEQDAFQALRSEIDDWWQVFADRVSMDARGEGTGFAIPSSTSNWCPGARPCCRLRTALPRSTSAGSIAPKSVLPHRRRTCAGRSIVTFGIALLGGMVLAIATTALTLRLEREVERRLKETREPAPICRLFRPGWCARRRMSAAPWRVNCTTKSGNRFPPS